MPFLSLTKSTAGGLTTIAGTAALDVHMLRRALIVLVVDTVRRLTVDADDAAWMLQRTGIRAFSALYKALTAGILVLVRPFPADTYIAFTAVTLIVLGRNFYTEA